MNNLATVVVKRGGDLQYALSLARNAVAADKNANYYDTLGSVLLALKQYDEAYKALQSAMDTDRDNPLWLLRRGGDPGGGGQDGGGEGAAGEGGFAACGLVED